MSYSEFLNMPVYIRKYMVDKLIEEFTPKNN
jgi:hypothetical protein